MRIAILDAFSGIAGDMTLGALLAVGLDRDWLEALPATLGLDGVTVRIREVLRGEIVCMKVDFDIPPQPHGRGIREIRELVERSGVVPDVVRARADRAFVAIATAEGEIHGMPPEEVHLHEVGAVDAILDVVGSIWGFHKLGVDAVYCGALSVGDGTVRAAHGVLPVPAPATLKLLEGHPIRPGPEGAGELVTPTGAALVRVMSEGAPPNEYVPLRSGFGAGTKDFRGRANALRIVIADAASSADGQIETIVTLACDIDDMSPEYVAGVADLLREQGALDVTLAPTIMKKGRAGVRIDVLARPVDADRLELTLLRESTTIGVRRTTATRRVLPRETREVDVEAMRVRVKVVRLPDGSVRAKPEFDDVRRAAEATGKPLRHIFDLAQRAAERA